MVWQAIASIIAPFLGGLVGGDDKSSQPQKLPTMAPGQEKLHNLITSMSEANAGGANSAFDLLKQYMDPNSDVYRNFEAPYMQQFQQQTVPQLAEQFGGFGANSGALSSSGFGQALGAAGSNLQTNLAQMKSGMQRNAINDFLSNFMNMTGQSLNKDPFAYHQQDKGGGFESGFGSGASSGIIQFLAALSNMSGGGGGGYQAKNPLSNTYGDMFKTGYADFMGY